MQDCLWLGVVRKRLQRREGLNWTQRDRALLSSLGRAVSGVLCEQKSGAQMGSPLRGHEAVRLVGQDIGCNQAAVAVKVGSRFRR